MLNELPGSTNELQVGRVAAQFSKVARGGKFGFEQRREEEKKRERGKKEKNETSADLIITQTFNLRRDRGSCE